MATQTERLRAALIARGFTPMDHAAARECLKGTRPEGGDLYIWLDKAGGGRYCVLPKIGPSRPLSAVTVKLLIAGKPSKVVGGAA